MKTSVVLKRARKLISRPERWNNDGDYAATKDGFVLDSGNDPDAYSFCAIGAVQSVTNGACGDVDHPKGAEMDFLRDAACRFKPYHGYTAFDHTRITRVNDFRTHRTVLRMFDSAIRLAERQEAKTKR